jgi:hypothetical protein
MSRWKKILLWTGVIALAAILLINPRLTNPPVAPGSDLMASNSPPAEIATILRNACYDCHSHETKWPWYSHVAPVSWWLVDHIKHARERLNFSDWSHDDARRSARRWRSMGEAVADREMPLPSYLRGHPEARLTDQQRQTFADWSEWEADRLIETVITEEEE